MPRAEYSKGRTIDFDGLDALKFEVRRLFIALRKDEIDAVKASALNQVLRTAALCIRDDDIPKEFDRLQKMMRKAGIQLNGAVKQ